MAVQWTPYAAIQLQSFRTPSFGEVVASGSPEFALNTNGRTATAVRGELGGRADKTFAFDNGSQLNLFGKVAWAHDEISDPTLNVSFIGLPIASFAVNGAAQRSRASDRRIGVAARQQRFGAREVRRRIRRPVADLFRHRTVALHMVT
jgi:outer membrane autotransporter protein